MAECGSQPESFDVSPFLVSEEEVHVQLGWSSDKLLTVCAYNNEVNIHIRRLMRDNVKGWIPAETGIFLSPSEFRELAQACPRCGKYYHLGEEELREQNLVK